MIWCGLLDAAQCDLRSKIVKIAKREGVMTEGPQRGVSTAEQSATDTTARFTKALDFMIGAQKIMLEEIVFTSNEMLDRARTETHLFSEFVSKMAGSHSVKDWKSMWEECGQHQIDFVRRDTERLFRHGKRMAETASKLFDSRPQR
jgi:hypothetical protein